MCTLSWVVTADGYELRFNRDEARERAPELPPRVFEREGSRFAAPLDGEAQGTWLAVNEMGTCVTLLNAYRPSRGVAPTRWRTRGELVLALADSTDPAHVQERLHARLDERDLHHYRPFVLFAIDRAGRSRSWSWDGLELESVEEPPAPLASSGVVQASAQRSRAEVWSRTVGELPGIEALDAFHRSHDPERGALSVCMHRDDACTRSLVRVSVDEARIVLEHEAAAPCSRVTPTRVVLVDRAQPSSRQAR